MKPTGHDQAAKSVLRRELLAARRAVPAEIREAEAAALAEAVAGVGWLSATVCAYVPVETEPGSLSLLDALRSAGRRVLLPVVVGAAALDWGVYFAEESLVAGPHGLREPAGLRLGPAAVANAHAILVPALGVDRSGVRLGRGAGHYDRSLAQVGPGVPLIGVVRDEELVEELPAEPHDVRLTAVLTPNGGLRELPRRSG